MYYSFYKRVQTNDMFSNDSLQLDTEYDRTQYYTHTMYYSLYKRVQTNDMFLSNSSQLDTTRKILAVWDLKAKTGNIREQTLACKIEPFAVLIIRIVYNEVDLALFSALCCESAQYCANRIPLGKQQQSTAITDEK